MHRWSALVNRKMPAVLLAACAVAQAQESLPVPTREAFVDRECAPALMREIGDDAGGAAFARAACECSYRLLSDRRTMTREEFDAAATLCRAEYAQDGASFLDKYGD